MLRRTLDAAFAGGMYVFPGGAVDDADRSADVEAWCDGLTDQQASRMLDVDAGGLAYWIAAIRECFEEAGVLLARRGDGTVVRFDDPAVEQRYLAHRSAVHDGALRLIDLCGADGLRLTTDDIHYVSHWVTPVGERRRFDTRFFLARAPQAQEPLHDDHETIASLWVGPADALARHERGELAMIAPTTKNLELLRPHAHGRRGARGRRHPRSPAHHPPQAPGERARTGGGGDAGRSRLRGLPELDGR